MQSTGGTGVPKYAILNSFSTIFFLYIYARRGWLVDWCTKRCNFISYNNTFFSTFSKVLSIGTSVPRYALNNFSCWCFFSPYLEFVQDAVEWQISAPRGAFFTMFFFPTYRSYATCIICCWMVGWCSKVHWYMPRLLWCSFFFSIHNKIDRWCRWQTFQGS